MDILEKIINNSHKKLLYEKDYYLYINHHDAVNLSFMHKSK